MKSSTIVKNKNNLNLPNLLSLLRILMIGVFVYLFVNEKFIGALVTYLLASLTDVIDGYIARKYNLITHLGKLLDPLADKLMLVTVLICMYTINLIPLWLLILIVAKELLQVGGGILMFSKKDTVVQANYAGKITTALFSISIVLLFLHEYVAPLDTYAIFFTALFAVVTLFQYIFKYTVMHNAVAQKKECATEDEIELQNGVNQQTE